MSDVKCYTEPQLVIGKGERFTSIFLINSVMLKHVGMFFSSFSFFLRRNGGSLAPTDFKSTDWMLDDTDEVQLPLC